MLHSTLSALLVSVASRYAQLSPSDVGIGIGGGRLVIDDVQLRADTFNGPHIPFRVHQGRAGRLRVNVPWSALSSSPVQVYLENVHLIAAPKPSADPNLSTLAVSAPEAAAVREHFQHPWHQTNVGRLLFNVSIEIYGLKVEYRDDDCIGVISVASLRAFSAGPDWNMHFVSLVPDLNRDQPDASAVAMRKTVNLTGVHFVMIPRSKKTTAPPTPERPVERQGDSNVEVKEGLPEGGAPQEELADHPHRNLDLQSFESKSPILDGVSISLRVLLCTGATVLPSQPDRLTAGLHGEVNVEIDEPTVKLTARQLIWIDHILKQGLGLSPNHRHSVSKADTKRRPRRDSTSLDANASPGARLSARADGTVLRGNEAGGGGGVDLAFEGEVPDSPARSSSHQSGYAGGSDGGDDSDGDLTDQAEPDVAPVESAYSKRDSISSVIRRSEERSGLFSVWDAIVGENYDETVDDAAIALGLWKDVDENGDGYGYGEHSHASGASSANSEDMAEDEDDEDDGEDQDGEDQQYARRAVQLAAECGGVTWEVRLRTTDMKAWERVEELEKEIAAARDEVSDRAELSQSVDDAHARVAVAEASVAEAETRAERLAERNAALGKELEELESMTGDAGKNKDAMIRQMQGALARAERNLQGFYQQGFVANAQSMSSSPSVREVVADSVSDGHRSVDDGANAEDSNNSNNSNNSYSDTGRDAVEGMAQAIFSNVEQDVGEPHVPHFLSRESTSASLERVLTDNGIDVHTETKAEDMEVIEIADLQRTTQEVEEQVDAKVGDVLSTIDIGAGEDDKQADVTDPTAASVENTEEENAENVEEQSVEQMEKPDEKLMQLQGLVKGDDVSETINLNALSEGVEYDKASQVRRNSVQDDDVRGDERFRYPRRSFQRIEEEMDDEGLTLI